MYCGWSGGRGMSVCGQFTRPGQVALDRPAADACMSCGFPYARHVLQAVLDALDIPFPGTVGDGEVYDRILAERIRHTVVFLRSQLNDRTASMPPEWGLEYFQERLAENPATGYHTWAGEAMAELRAAGGLTVTES